MSAGSLLILLEGKKREADAFFSSLTLSMYLRTSEEMDVSVGRYILLTPLCVQWETCGIAVSITYKVSNMGTKGHDMGINLKLCVAIILKSKY